MISYLVGGVALVGGALLLRKYFHGRPTRFTYDGAAYVHHPDGSFTSEGGAPVLSPELEKVQAYWNETHNADGTHSDGGSDGGDGGGGGD